MRDTKTEKESERRKEGDGQKRRTTQNEEVEEEEVEEENDMKSFVLQKLSDTKRRAYIFFSPAYNA